MALTIAYLFPRNDATGIDDQGSISVSWCAPVLTLVTSTSSRLIRNPWELKHPVETRRPRDGDIQGAPKGASGYIRAATDGKGLQSLLRVRVWRGCRSPPPISRPVAGGPESGDAADFAAGGTACAERPAGAGTRPITG